MRKKIELALNEFRRNPLLTSAQYLFNLLGYQTERRISLEPNNAEGFLKRFDQSDEIDSDRAEIQEWNSIDLLFQLTESDILNNAQTNIVFEGRPAVETSIQSYLFFALRLNGSRYNRTQLTDITREINKLTPMPAIAIFQYGEFLALAVFDRRPDKRDACRDVLEDFAIVQDIDFGSPHRVHVDVLFNLSPRQLYERYQFRTFADFHQAWQKTLHSFDPSAINRAQSVVPRYDASRYPSEIIAEILTQPYKVIRDMFDYPYEEMFEDVEYDTQLTRNHITSSLVSGRYQVI